MLLNSKDNFAIHNYEIVRVNISVLFLELTNFVNIYFLFALAYAKFYLSGRRF